MVTAYRKHKGNVDSKQYGTKRLAKRLQNLEKGDVIMDIAFAPHAKGGTKECLALWDVIKKHVDMFGFTVAKMEYKLPHAYIFTLTHTDGFKIVLHGVGAGFYGQGPRGTESILKDCGFSNPERVFLLENETFTFKRTIV